MSLVSVHTNSGDSNKPCLLCKKLVDTGCDKCGEPHKYQCTRGCHIKVCDKCATFVDDKCAYVDIEGWRKFSSRRGHLLYACSYRCIRNTDCDD